MNPIRFLNFKKMKTKFLNVIFKNVLALFQSSIL